MLMDDMWFHSVHILVYIYEGESNENLKYCNTIVC